MADSNGDFVEAIRSDLIKEGYSGQELQKELKSRQVLALAHTEGAVTSVCTKEDVAYTVYIRKMYLLTFLTPIIIIFFKGVYRISPYMYMQT